MNLDNKIIEKIKKLVSLAEHPATSLAEIDSAKFHIQKILVKYRITLEDIFEEKKCRREFRIKSDWEWMLLNQVVQRYVDRKVIVGKYRRHKICVADLTGAEFIDVSEAWTFHRDLFRTELKNMMKIFTQGYVHKHDLFTVNVDADDDSEKTPVDMEEIKRIIAVMNGMSDKSYHKKLHA